jgi:hypothetical protein
LKRQPHFKICHSLDEFGPAPKRSLGRSMIGPAPKRSLGRSMIGPAPKRSLGRSMIGPAPKRSLGRSMIGVVSCSHLPHGVTHGVVTNRLALTAIASLLCCNCGDNIDPLPEGLDNIEDNSAPLGPRGNIQFSNGKDGYLWLHGRAEISGDVAMLWTGIQNPDLVVATCSLSRYRATTFADDRYDFSFMTDNEVDNVVTVAWQETWRFGTLNNSDTDSHRRIRYQKTQGSSFISLIEGQLDITASQQKPNIIDIGFIEHLDAIGGGIADMTLSMQHRFDVMLALATATVLPACP